MQEHYQEHQNAAEARSTSAPHVAPLSSLREYVGLTQHELAEEMGVSEARVSDIEDACDLSVSALDSYVSALGGRLVLLAEIDGQTFDLFLRGGAQGVGGDDAKIGAVAMADDALKQKWQ